MIRPAAYPVGDTPKSLLGGDTVVRGVTLAGAFVPVAWATGGRVLTMDQVKQMYSANDFEEMIVLGVKTVQIPVPLGLFVEGGERLETLTHLMNHVDKVGLKAIIVLVDDSNENDNKESIKQVTAAATYANADPSILAIQIPSPSSTLIDAVRTISSTLPILVPINKGQVNTLSFSPDSTPHWM